MSESTDEQSISFELLEKVINSDIESFDSIPRGFINKLTRIQGEGSFSGKWILEVDSFKLALIRRELLRCNSEIYVLFTNGGDFLDMEETLIWCSTIEGQTKFYSKVVFSSTEVQFQIMKLDTTEKVIHPDLAKVKGRTIINVKESGVFERRYLNK